MMSAHTHAGQQYAKLENRLILLAWLNSLFGYESNREMLEDCKRADEGFRADGRSFLYHHLIARGNKLKISEDDLRHYDENIRQHLEKINRGRKEKITLRYFQHMAALYTEIVLDRLFTNSTQLLHELNNFVEGRNDCRGHGEPKESPFRESDLTKLAFWMATGSGKTLLLHINYYQFLHYNREPLSNILLVTPNEGLSEQHLQELAASNIPAQRFDLNAGALRMGDRNVVQVIEVTKLVQEKRGGGVSVPVEAFEGRNLVFVDEGHKGTGGQAWRNYRDALGDKGFTFEYSATFGQALSAAGKDELTAEYGKAIAFDYSYRYFYSDGFGKDFRILNLKSEPQSNLTDMLLLGNLLTFYEQLRLYEEQSDKLRPYNLEKPLWVFVGSTVNAIYKEDNKPRSDVLTVVNFLHRVLSDCEWAETQIQKILMSESGLQMPDGSDVFANRFAYLKGTGAASQQLYNDILRRVFHTEMGGGLHLVDIKSSASEIGLKAANAQGYFGVISIGDAGDFKKLVEQHAPQVKLEQDAIAPSLFADINRPDSKIHILIGAKKFIEGWNSWRVASMGLLNIGKNEGAQIIQLFGRGVRLKGRGMSLKRSAALEGKHPEHIGLLETLNIFAVRANYMAQFRAYLEREGVEVEPPIQLCLPMFFNLPNKPKLLVPRPDSGYDFNTVLVLKVHRSIQVYLDLSVKVQTIQSTQAEIKQADAVAGQAQKIPPESLQLVDWHQVYFDLLAHKERRGLHNLVIHPDAPRQIMEKLRYTLVADESVVRPRFFADCTLLQRAVTQMLCRYIDKFYQEHREQWEQKNLVYKELDQDDPNLSFRPSNICEQKACYVVSIPRSEQQLVEAVQKLLEDEQWLRGQENGDLPRLNFDRHLYMPLLLQKPGVQVSPPALTPSEGQFVRDLKKYWEEEKDRTLQGKEIFLLRNLSRGRGIGFFEERGFYPDFILWIVEGEKQRIVFIEPHGMLHAKAYVHDEKARLWEQLPKLAQKIEERSGRKDISLDSYIVSATPCDELRKRYDNGKWGCQKFAKRHILFPDCKQYDYIKIILGENHTMRCT